MRVASMAGVAGVASVQVCKCASMQVCKFQGNQFSTARIMSDICYGKCDISSIRYTLHSVRVRYAFGVLLCYC